MASKAAARHHMIRHLPMTRRTVTVAVSAVVAVAVIVDRATGAKERIEAEGFPYFYALGLEDIGLA